MKHRGPQRSTPEGQHRPVLLQEVLNVLDPKPGQVVVDCTLGWAGHSAELLARLGPDGLLISLDLDQNNLVQAEERLREVGHPFRLHHTNFAGLAQILALEQRPQVDSVLADLGMSSMQVDDPERGFSYSRDGLLDMRMDQSRGRSAAQILATITEKELARALNEYGDEPQAELIAATIVKAREVTPFTRTKELSRLIQDATKQQDWQLHPKRGSWKLHPAARSFQALRILVNRELSNLENLLRVLPNCLVPGGRVGIISFHSGEDRLVKNAFRAGQREGTYTEIAEDPIRASFAEREENPRSRSAKLRWAFKSISEPIQMDADKITD